MACKSEPEGQGLEADEHGGPVRWRAGLAEEARSSFEKNRSNNPTSSDVMEVGGVEQCSCYAPKID